MPIIDENLCPLGFVESEPSFVETDLTGHDNVCREQEHAVHMNVDVSKEGDCLVNGITSDGIESKGNMSVEERTRRSYIRKKFPKKLIQVSRDFPVSCVHHVIERRC